MIILKYPTYESQLANIEGAMAGTNDAALINVIPGDTRPWVTTGGVSHMGYALRGDATPTWWVPTAAAGGDDTLKTKIPWNALVPWFVFSYGVDNQAVNTRVNVSNIILQVFDQTINAWREIDTGGNVVWCNNQDYGANTITDHGNATKRIESDGSWSIHIDPIWGAIHGGTNKFHIPDTVTDPLDVKGIFVRMTAKLVLDDLSGVDDRHLAQILISVGADPWPETTTVLADLRPTGYAPTAAISRWITIDSAPQNYFMATIDPPAINPTISPYVVAGNRVLMPVADFESYLPPYIL